MLFSIIFIVFISSSAFLLKDSPKIKRKVKALKMTYKVVSKIVKLTLHQYLNDSITKVSKNRYILNYVLDNTEYKIIIDKIISKNVDILQVSDDNDIDRTNELISYAGPNRDFHNNSIQVSFFNTDKLFFLFSDGSEKIFSNDDIIII